MDTTIEQLEPIKRLTRDLKNASKLMTRLQARYLVDSYYQLQEVRKASANQVKAVKKTKETAEVIEWFCDEAMRLETQIQRALTAYAEKQRVCRWAMLQVGIGPVISAGLHAHIDILKAPTTGHIWRFAGVDPTMVWEAGKKRPFNASLKVLFWKIGQSFLKFQNHEDCMYGRLLVDRWEFEKKNNTTGKLTNQAVDKLKKFNIKKNTEAYPWYAGHYSMALLRTFMERGVDYMHVEELSEEEKESGKKPKRWRQLPTVVETQAMREGATGDKYEKLQAGMKAAGFLSAQEYPDWVGTPMLPPAHILQRACRWATKLFISHYHDVAWECETGEKPVKPYVYEHLGHGHLVVPPHWPCD